MSDLTEESSAPSPPQRLRRGSSARASSRLFDASDVTGSTIIPMYSPEPNDLDPSMLVEALPDLQRAATGVLDFLTPASLDPVSILSLARRLRDPNNTQSRRLSRFVTNLRTESRFFGSSMFIDVDTIGPLLPSLDGSVGKDGRKWHPILVLLNANCALCAVDLLFQTHTPKRIIRELEARFPYPFMTEFDGDGKGQSDGRSALERATFNLALDIRTQYLRMELEARQNEVDFDPEAILRSVFYDERPPDEVDSDADQDALRGFRIPPFQDEHGHLPADIAPHYKELVYDRVQDISMQLRSFNDDDEDNDSEDRGTSVNIRGLKAAYHWQSFAFRAVRWIRERDEEIRKEMKGLPAVDDVRDGVARRLDLRNRSTSNWSNVSPPPLPPTPQQDQRPESVNQARGRAERRQSKGPFLNAASIERVHERLRSRTRPPSGSNTVAEGSSRPPHQQTATIRGEPVQADHSAQHPPADLDNTLAAGTDLDFELDAVAVSTPQKQPMARGARLREPTAEAQQRRAFIDRQEDARRVSPISQAPRSANRQPGRRRAHHQDSSGSDSEGDESDAFSARRPIDRNGKRPQSPEQPQRKRQRLNGDENARDRNAASRAPDRGPTVVVRREEPQQREEAGVSRQLAGDRRRRSPPTIPETGWLSSASTGERNYRKRWSEEETARLVKLISIFGPQWARIKRQDDLCPSSEGGPKLTQRSQVQLKDRARNMVLSYLRLVLRPCTGYPNPCLPTPNDCRSGEDIPPKFNEITVRRADLERLENQGVHIPDDLWGGDANGG